MLEAMARIAPSQPNEAMARIASRRNGTISLDQSCLPELRSRLADPRREEVPREKALVHARHVTNPLQGAAPHVVVQIPNADKVIFPWG